MDVVVLEDRLDSTTTTTTTTTTTAVSQQQSTTETCGTNTDTHEQHQQRLSVVSSESTDAKETGEFHSPQKHQQQLPHIIFIVIDDLGSNDIGYHGSSGIYTPVMDDLIHTGILLTNYYVLPYCSPTRAAIMSGRYPLHTGCHTIIKALDTQGLPLDEETIPQILRKAQYKAHAVGKWHIGHAMYEQTPTFRGFESFKGYYRGWSDYYTHYVGDSVTDTAAYEMHYDTKEFCGVNCSEYVDERGNYSTHVFTRDAIRIIQQHYHSEPTNGVDSQTTQSPLFLYLAYQAVHAPEEVPYIYEQLYDNRTLWTKQRKIYAGMLSAVDESIGNITETLKQTGDMWNNTIVVVTTDNGGPTAICAVQGSMNKPPRRGGKCTIWEGGTTGDAFMTGPVLNRWREQKRKKLNPSTTEKTTEYPYLFHAVDWLPTLAAIAGVKPNGKPLDGVNQLDALLDFDPHTRSYDLKPPPREEVFVGYATFNDTWYGPAIRWKQWKLLQGFSGGPEESSHVHPEYVQPPGYALPAVGGRKDDVYQLYNIDIDPGESNDVSNDHPQIVSILQKKLQFYQQTYVPPIANNDGDCGAFNGISHTVQYGPVWHPWCKKLIIYE
jgi:arylsulfatase B